MAEYCVCCGKKVGIFTGGHLDNTVCDSCYFKFAGYVEELKNVNNAEEVETRFINAIRILNGSGFLADGEKRIITYIEEIKQKKLEDVQKEQQALTRSIEEQKKHDEIQKQYSELKVKILLTTGNNFEGYDIIDYCGVKSGSIVLGTGFLSEFSASFSDFSGTKDYRMGKKVEEAKAMATNTLIENCIYAGGNAIIGVGSDIMTIGTNMIVVSANGTSVKIEKKNIG
ncbi:MAG: heavy metal-binding domain-containing protein [Lachnospiraceae bacterium]|nr:heavy metal-binding domain-containing protein [Lachnospiraceae bacterium]